jgi:hypothetical protein
MLLEQGGRGTRDGAKVIIIVGVGDFGMGCSVKIVGVIMSRALAFGSGTWRDSSCSSGFGGLVGFRGFCGRWFGFIVIKESRGKVLKGRLYSRSSSDGGIGVGE